MKAYVHTKVRRGDGYYDTFLTVEVEVKQKLLWWQEKCLIFTATGYGSAIPTDYMIKYNGRWRRVKCCIFSNSGVLFIGKKLDPQLTVDIER